MSDPGRYLAGVGIALATTFMSALGMTLQKRTHQRLEGRREAARRKHRTDAALASYKQPLWVVGLVLMAASALLSLAVFALVGQSVASAFASITIVWSLLLSVAVLRERITPLDVIVATLMITGTVLAVYFGSRGANGGSFLSLDDILRLQRRPAAYAGWAVFGSLILLLGGYSVWQDRRLLLGSVTRRDAQFRATIAARCATAGLFSGIVGFLSKAVVSIFAKSASGAVGRNLARW
jgi:drug/metabolite transporter (DMT)-like permease